MDIDVVTLASGRPCRKAMADAKSPATYISPEWQKQVRTHDCDIQRPEKDDLREIMKLFDVSDRPSGRLQIEKLALAIDTLGGDRRAYLRERASAVRAIVAEVYSPPRVTAAAGRLPKYGLQPGLALDITVDDDTGKPYDFSIKSQREKAERKLDEQQPLLLIGTPMCTAFSAIQAINNCKRDPQIVAREQAAGRLHLQWCCYLYRKQVARGAYFLHEHPNSATSWREPCVLGVLSLNGGKRIRADQCMHGQESQQGNPLKKPTGFMSNAPCLLDALNRRCFGRKGLCSRPSGGRHQDCLGNVARRAAIFSDDMCEVILSGFSAQLKADRRMRENEHGVNHIMLEGSDEINLWTDTLKCAQEGLQRGTRPGKQRNPDLISDALADTPSQRGTRPG